ncbi:MAG: colanic acid biosynthesis glycosyltransferase WcaL [Chloroflexi bacterium]|nr:MAG: colanic acid biosynthesis glycosyltransferase WcaL [Chloroflexota bacterium]
MSKQTHQPANTPYVAYIMKGYPRISETFILNEIYRLEQMGVKLHIFSAKRSQETRQHAVVSRIQANVTYLPLTTSISDVSFSRWMWINLPHYWRAHWALLRQRPLAYVRTLAEAIYRTVKYRRRRFGRFKKVIIKEFLQAGYIARQVIADGRIRHLHGHFCHGSTTITMFTSLLSGIPYSFTAHAKDIYLRRLNPGDLLQVKIRQAQFVATCTDYNRQHLERLCPDGAPVYTVYHGLDTEMFVPQKRPSASPPIILAVGRFVRKKGFPYLIEACHLLRQAGISFACHIVGEEGEDSPIVQQRIQELGLADVVHIHRAVTQQELREIYGRCTLFVLPCRVVENGDRDGIPNVLAEAMAVGIPVISTTVSGIPELVDDGQNGLLVPPEDAQALANSIRYLLTHPEQAAKLGENARQKICQMFDVRQTTVRLKSLFDLCLTWEMEQRKTAVSTTAIWAQLRQHLPTIPTSQ